MHKPQQYLLVVSFIASICLSVAVILGYQLIQQRHINEQSSETEIVNRNRGYRKEVSDCIQACEQARNAGKDLTTGPCLLNPLRGTVCDVAHDPRQDIDDQPENQCNSYPRYSDNFVEVSPDCQLIRYSNWYPEKEPGPELTNESDEN